VVYIIALLLMGVIFHRLFHPRGGRLWLALNLHTNESELTRESLIIRLRRWWYPVLLGFPAWLIVLSLIGYVYTAVRLNVQVNASLLLVIAAVIGYFLIVRWLAVKKGKIAFQQRLDRRREAAGARNDAQKSGDTVPPPEEPEIDLAELTFQTRQLIRTFAGLVVVIGLWWIWSAELPALEYLNRITLWKVTTLVNGVEQTVPVTLAGVIAAAALGFLFAVGYQNLPGMLEIMVLQNFNLARGSRYAITTIAQYAVAACGIIVVLSRLGMNWSQLGWIAAALSVGLGFGLQEVVANFVCGILIFVEQPVRVGDIVTVADVTGTVTRIQIRATTITDWDRKEFIVPNKEFITGRILNWTLSNTMSRITIDVGIAYGSDTDLACRLLLEAGREHPQVLDDPAPMAHFEGFGESSLDLKLRCYLATADNRLDIMHGLRTVIARKFKAAGLEIPFPQRDLHIRSAGPLIRTGSTSGDSRLDAS
jgi:potassium efflux system protein